VCVFVCIQQQQPVWNMCDAYLSLIPLLFTVPPHLFLIASFCVTPIFFF
jgi:hypothetical protein